MILVLSLLLQRINNSGSRLPDGQNGTNPRRLGGTTILTVFSINPVEDPKFRITYRHRQSLSSTAEIQTPPTPQCVLRYDDKSLCLNSSFLGINATIIVIDCLLKKTPKTPNCVIFRLISFVSSAIRVICRV